jgi:hypothetical protein
MTPGPPKEPAAVADGFRPEASALIRAFIVKDFHAAHRIIEGLNHDGGPGLGFGITVATMASVMLRDAYGGNPVMAADVAEIWLRDSVKDKMFELGR